MVNGPQLVSDPVAVRWSVNNYYLAHMRDLGLMALAFDPSDSWRRSCSSWFDVPTDDNNLQFGVLAFTGSASGTWLVDDVEIISESVFGDGFESGDTSRWAQAVQ